MLDHCSLTGARQCFRSRDSFGYGTHRNVANSALPRFLNTTYLHYALWEDAPRVAFHLIRNGADIPRELRGEIRDRAAHHTELSFPTLAGLDLDLGLCRACIHHSQRTVNFIRWGTANKGKHPITSWRPWYMPPGRNVDVTVRDFVFAVLSTGPSIEHPRRCDPSFECSDACRYWVGNPTPCLWRYIDLIMSRYIGSLQDQTEIDLSLWTRRHSLLKCTGTRAGRD
jgi:hypothetical protein